MAAGLLWFWLRAKPTLGPIGFDIVRDPDPAVQAKREQGVKTWTYGGLAVLAGVFIAGASGMLTIDAQVLGQYMTFVLVGIAVVFFAYIFLAGSLSGDEKKRPCQRWPRQPSRKLMRRV